MKKLLDELGLSAKQLRNILTKKRYRPHIIHSQITDRTFKFGVVSDTHLCSTHEALDELHTFYSICKKEGVEDVVHAGDIVDGSNVYQGHQNFIKVFGAAAQVAYAVSNYPRGARTHFIGGNHDLDFMKRAGVDIGELIASQREDMLYVGPNSGEVVINGVKIRLIHPHGGMPYSISYRGQKILENLASGQKPHVLVLGHLHVSYYFFGRNVHVIGGGAFQKQTDLLARMGVNPVIGGWIVRVRVANDKKNSVVAITPTFIPFF